MKPHACRVAIHSRAGQFDLVLPRNVPLGALLPEVCDIVGMPGRWLCPPARPPLDPEKTLSENGIDDGDLLVLTTEPAPQVPAPVLDCAAGLARLSDTEARAGIDARAAGAMIAVPLAAVGGVLSVPGAPGIPHLLLGASTAGAVAAVTARRVAQGRTASTAIAFGCALVAAVTLGVTAFGGGIPLAGALLATAAVGVLVGAGRLTLLICGVSPAVVGDLSIDAPAPAAASPFIPQCLTALVLAGSGIATVGVLLTVTQRPAAARCVLAGAVTVALLLRARTHSAPVRRGFLLLCGSVCAATTLAATGLAYPVSARWLGAAALAAAAAATGSRIPRRPPPPGAGQLAHAAECAGLIVIIPTACWALGLFDAVRSMGPA